MLESGLVAALLLRLKDEDKNIRCSIVDAISELAEYGKFLEW